MTAARLTYGDWKAPTGDGQVLIWPDGPDLLAQTRDNHRRLQAADSVLVQNVPLSDLRQAQRRWLGHDADDQPLIATGHQIELYHPGVWAKDAFIDQLAAKLGGAAYHFAVDTDAPKHLYLRWPGGSGPITDDPRIRNAAWAGLLEIPSPAHLKELLGRFNEAAAQWDFQPLVDDVLGTMVSLTLESSSLTSVLINSIHQLDWSLGLRHHAMLVSPIWMSPGYHVLVHHILARADSFNTQYNAILGEYRREQGISDPGRPWPDLRCSADGCEVPFWLDCQQTQQRQRAMVRHTPEGWALEHGADRFVFDPGADGWKAGEMLGRFLIRHDLRLSPRALTLTLFFRLLVVDQFAHGIGGGQYDQVTDRVIARCFGIAPPAFSVTTATLFFPAAVGQKRAALEPLLVEGRRLRHAWGDARKRQMAVRIASLPRNSSARQQVFRDMHGYLATIAASPQYKDWERRLEQTRQLQDRQKTLFDRELFFAVQPEHRLRKLIARYQAHLAAL